MRMVFSAAEKAGWLEGGQKRLDFMGFGLVQGQDGFLARKEQSQHEDLTPYRWLIECCILIR